MTIAQAPGEVDVGAVMAGDALVVHVAGDHRGAERDGGDDGGLGPGVVALHVGGGVALGVAQLLRLGQGVGVGDARLGHPREDVVGGAVDDAHHPADALPHQRLAQRPDDRDAAGHGRLEEQVDTGGVRRRRTARRRALARSSLLPVMTGLPALRAERMRSRAGSMPPMSSTTRSMSGSSTIAAASCGEELGRERDRALLGEVAHGDPGDLEAESGAGLDRWRRWVGSAATRGAPTFPHPARTDRHRFVAHRRPS